MRSIRLSSIIVRGGDHTTTRPEPRSADLWYVGLITPGALELLDDETLESAPQSVQFKLLMLAIGCVFQTSENGKRSSSGKHSLSVAPPARCPREINSKYMIHAGTLRPSRIGDPNI